MASQHSHRCAWRWTLEEKCLETIAVPLSSHCSLSWGSFPIVLCWSKMNNKRFVYLNHWKWMAQTHRNACEHNPPTHHILHHTSLHHTPPHTPYPTTTITTTPHSTDTQSLEIIREDVTKENVILLPFVLWGFFFFATHPEKTILNCTRSFEPMVPYRTMISETKCLEVSMVVL